ncbi:DUF4238 domain-containing protein [Nonomuraea sp. NPDC049421]|uniref:DUF4238 domain-containing protein n=1 Tax=Nonomuraea sp. NPDC049421 TaxID=3155275 RepID=UPI003430BFF8
MTHAKKHHFVPQFLLRRFAGSGEKLTVHHVTRGVIFTSTVRNIGHRNLGHTMTMPGSEPDHTTLETEMSKIEAEAAAAISKLSTSNHKIVPDELRPAIAWFLALQWQRSRFLLHVTEKELSTLGHDNDAKLHQTIMLRHIRYRVIFPWSLRHDPNAYYKDAWNNLVAILTSPDMHWSCYRPKNPSLIVSDASICFSGARDGFVPEIPSKFLDHGIGAGFHGFRRMTVPLGSRLGLIISSDRNDARRIRASEFNKFTVFNSREFVAHAPDWAAENQDLAMELQEHLWVQRTISPVFLFGYSGKT